MESNKRHNSSHTGRLGKCPGFQVLSLSQLEAGTIKQ